MAIRTSSSWAGNSESRSRRESRLNSKEKIDCSLLVGVGERVRVVSSHRLPFVSSLTSPERSFGVRVERVDEMTASVLESDCISVVVPQLGEETVGVTVGRYLRIIDDPEGSKLVTESDFSDHKLNRIRSTAKQKERSAI